MTDDDLTELLKKTKSYYILRTFLMEGYNTSLDKNINSVGGHENIYDWVRLIATIFVVVGHASYISMTTTYGGVQYDLPSNLNPIYYSSVLTWIRSLQNWVYGFHMPLFFMLSGAAMGLKPIPTFDSFIKNKVKRLLVPYFVYGWFFMLPLKRIGNFYNNETLKQAMQGFLSGEDSGHLWFLTALFWCMVVFVAIVKLLDAMKIKSVYSVLILCGIVWNCMVFVFIYTV